MASRHGARYPKPETVTKLLTLEKFREQIVHNHEHRRCELNFNCLDESN